MYITYLYNLLHSQVGSQGPLISSGTGLEGGCLFQVGVYLRLFKFVIFSEGIFFFRE